MKIIVPVKRVVDHNVRIQVKPDGSGVALDGVKMSINPFDEIAVEAAVRFREAGAATEVIVVSIGPQQATETLRFALALGADRGILVKADAAEPLAVAKILAAIVADEGATLALLGKQAIDDDCNQTAQMLSALLGWSQGTFASSIDLANGAATVTREVDGGNQTLKVALPAVISVDLRLNKPRNAGLPAIMKAKQKPIAERSPADVGVDMKPRLEVLNIAPPKQRSAGVVVGSVGELVAKLQHEARVI